MKVAYPSHYRIFRKGKGDTKQHEKRQVDENSNKGNPLDIPVHEIGNKKLSDSLQGDGRTRAELEVLISRSQGTSVFWGTGGWRTV